MEILKVSSHSSPNSVAGAVAGVIREQKAVEVQAVGAGASNQAIKAIAIARGYLAPIGIDLICIPAFANIQIDGEERTAINFLKFSHITAFFQECGFFCIKTKKADISVRFFDYSLIIDFSSHTLAISRAS